LVEIISQYLYSLIKRLDYVILNIVKYKVCFMAFKSGRGGSRSGSGRPPNSSPTGAQTHRIYIPIDIDAQLAVDCVNALIDARDNRSSARTHDALNKVLDSVFGVDFVSPSVAFTPSSSYII
jgi:hypothetical protein